MAIQRTGSGSLYWTGTASANSAAINPLSARNTTEISARGPKGSHDIADRGPKRPALHSERNRQPRAHGARRTGIDIRHHAPSEIRQRVSKLLVHIPGHVENIYEQRMTPDRPPHAAIERRRSIDRVHALIVQKRAPRAVVAHVRADREGPVDVRCRREAMTDRKSTRLN